MRVCITYNFISLLWNGFFRDRTGGGFDSKSSTKVDCTPSTIYSQKADGRVEGTERGSGGSGGPLTAEKKNKTRCHHKSSSSVGTEQTRH